MRHVEDYRSRPLCRGERRGQHVRCFRTSSERKSRTTWSDFQGNSSRHLSANLRWRTDHFNVRSESSFRNKYSDNFNNFNKQRACEFNQNKYIYTGRGSDWYDYDDFDYNYAMEDDSSRTITPVSRNAHSSGTRATEGGIYRQDGEGRNSNPNWTVSSKLHNYSNRPEQIGLNSRDHSRRSSTRGIRGKFFSHHLYARKSPNRKRYGAKIIGKKQYLAQPKNVRPISKLSDGYFDESPWLTNHDNIMSTSDSIHQTEASVNFKHDEHCRHQACKCAPNITAQNIYRNFVNRLDNPCVYRNDEAMTDLKIKTFSDNNLAEKQALKESSEFLQNNFRAGSSQMSVAPSPTYKCANLLKPSTVADDMSANQFKPSTVEDDVYEKHTNEYQLHNSNQRGSNTDFPKLNKEEQGIKKSADEKTLMEFEDFKLSPFGYVKNKDGGIVFNDSIAKQEERRLQDLSPEEFARKIDVIGDITNKVFVCNLHYDVTEEKLSELFNLAGHVIKLELQRNDQGHSSGKARIHYRHVKAAVRAIALFHRLMVNGRPILVYFARTRDCGVFRVDTEGTIIIPSALRDRVAMLPGH